MTRTNLATIIAPCVMRCPCLDLKKTVTFMEQEKKFLLGLFEGLDTRPFPNFILTDSEIDDVIEKKKKSRWPSLHKRHSVVALNLSGIKDDTGIPSLSSRGSLETISPPSYDESITTPEKVKMKKRKKYHSSTMISMSPHKTQSHSESTNDDQPKKSKESDNPK